MKLVLAFVLLISSQAFAADEHMFEFSVSVLEIDRGENTLNLAKHLLIDKAEKTCRVGDIYGSITQISGYDVTNIPAQDRSADPLCHWRQSCYIPAMIHVSATYLCKF